MRRLLRKILILGLEQLPNGRWIIRQISLEVATSCSSDSSLESDQIEKGEVEDDSCAIVSSILNRNKIASLEEAIRPNLPIPRGNGNYIELSCHQNSRSPSVIIDISDGLLLFHKLKFDKLIANLNRMISNISASNLSKDLGDIKVSLNKIYGGVNYL